MAKRDYYEVLGVDKGADDATIKKAYRTLAKKNHPDVNPGDKEAEERFKEINEAYQVLSNPQKRAQYDQFGHDGPQGFGGGAYSDYAASVSSAAPAAPAAPAPAAPQSPASDFSSAASDDDYPF